MGLFRIWSKQELLARTSPSCADASTPARGNTYQHSGIYRTQLEVDTDTTETTTSAWQERVRALKNVPPVLNIVWQSGPYVVLAGLFFRLLVSLVPTGMVWVTGAIIGEVARIVSVHQGATERLWWLVGAEFGLAVCTGLVWMHDLPASLRLQASLILPEQENTLLV